MGDTGLVHETFTNNRHHKSHGHHKQCPRIIIFSHSTIRSESIRTISVTESHSLSSLPPSITPSFTTPSAPVISSPSLLSSSPSNHLLSYRLRPSCSHVSPSTLLDDTELKPFGDPEEGTTGICQAAGNSCLGFTFAYGGGPLVLCTLYARLSVS